MKSKSYLKKIAVHACIYYTAASFLLLFLYWLLSKDLSHGIHPLAQLFILPFAFCFAAANICFTYWKEKTYVKVMVHYALTVGGAFFFLYLPNQAEDHAPAQGFIMFLALSLFYALILSVVGFVRSRIYRVKRDEKAYTSVYKKK